jgi:uncharacterized protein YgiM (DUF1202 family)
MPRSGTVPSMLIAAWAIVATHGAFAATKEPPYEAVVESDEAFFRCGPGKSFYPTGKLKRGDHVTVRRHDPGGWFMIDPPAGSFSLVASDDVNREGNIGTIKSLADGQTPVRIGSAIDPTIDSVYQRQLSSGERVEILGEATVIHRNAQVSMFKIRSPKGEFRWIEGMNLTPVDQQIQDQQIRDQQIRSRQPNEQADSDPFATAPPARKAAPSRGSQTITATPAAKLISSSKPTTFKRQVPTQSNPSPPNGALATTTIPPVEPHSRLEQIDSQFRDMIQRQPATWNLAQIEQAYRELSQQSPSVAMRGQLDLRFASIDHYKQIKGEYDDYFRLVSSTARKDAELAAIQNSADPQYARPPIMAAAQYPPSAEPSTNGSSNNFVGPTIPMPATNVPTEQAAPNVPEFNAQPRPSITPQIERPAAGPVLENPVPLPTEPSPQVSPNRQIQPESSPVSTAPPSTPPVSTPPVATPAVTPQDSYPNHELPMQPTTARPAAPQTQQPSQPSNDAFEMQSQPSPSTVAQPSAPNGPQTLNNPNVAPVGPQPAIAPLQPSSTLAMPSSPPLGPSPVSQVVPVGPMVPPMAPPRQIRPQAAGGLDGAGIVQMAATPIPGGPRHVLLAPNGRILAYLYPDRGINLDAYVGHSMGIVGPRSYRPELRNDLIVVRGMVPVRLAP